uniref:Uncharacterized protein LOC116953255 n=1 Tax=Petromyzon marinus TaxID=7757 RepID=A0AAJ7XCJ7_PETMA|nr:uncharacterized protein LOC116953255 [Petromyzon marinus]
MDHSFAGSGRSGREFYHSGRDDYDKHGRGSSGSGHRSFQGDMRPAEGERETYKTAANLLATIITMIKDNPVTDQGQGYAHERSAKSGYNYRESYNSAPPTGSKQSVGYNEPFSRPGGLAGGPDRYDYNEPPRGQQHGPQGYGGGYDDHWGSGKEFSEPGIMSNKHGNRGYAEHAAFKAPADMRGFYGRGRTSRNFHGQVGRPGFNSREGRQPTDHGGAPYGSGFRGYGTKPGQRGRPFDRAGRDSTDRRDRGRGGTPAWRVAADFREKKVVPLLGLTTSRKKKAGGRGESGGGGSGGSGGGAGAGGAPSTSQKPQKPTGSAGAGTGSEKLRVTDKPAATSEATGAIKRKLSPSPGPSGKKASNEESGGIGEPETKKVRLPAHSAQFSCPLCRFRTKYDSEMELHMQSKFHMESLRHLQEGYLDDPHISKTINEFIELRYQKRKASNQMLSDHSDKVVPSKANGDDAILDDSMESMEVVRCYACNTNIFNVTWVIRKHMDSEEHQFNRKAFSNDRKNSVLIIFKSILHNQCNFKILKTLNEKFQKEETSAGESSSSTSEEKVKKITTADDKTTVDNTTVEKNATLKKTVLKTSGTEASATKGQISKGTLKPRAKVVQTGKVVVKKANVLATEKAKDKFPAEDIDVKTSNTKQSSGSKRTTLQVGEDLSKREEDKRNNAELELEKAEEEQYEVVEPDEAENEEALKNECFVVEEGLLLKAKESDFLLQDEEQLLEMCEEDEAFEVCEEDEAPEEGDPDSLDDDTYLEVDALADDHDASFGDKQSMGDNGEKESKNEADDDVIIIEYDGDAALPASVVPTDMSGNGSEKPLKCPPVAADAITTTAPAPCTQTPRDALPPPTIKAAARKPVKGVTRVAGGAGKAGTAAKTSAKRPAGNAVKSVRVKAIKQAVRVSKVVVTKFLPAVKKEAVKKPLVKTIGVFEETILPSEEAAGEMAEAGKMLNTASQEEHASKPAAEAMACEEADEVVGSETPLEAEESKQDERSTAMALPEVVVMEGILHPARREGEALPASVRGRGARGRCKRGKRKAV